MQRAVARVVGVESIGNSANSVVVRDEMRCADSYIVERGLSMSHSPPTPCEASKPSNAMPAFCSARAAASPDGPAPITAYRCCIFSHTSVRVPGNLSMLPPTGHGTGPGASVICVRMSASGIVASPSPGCGP